MFEKVLSIDSSAFLGGEERKRGLLGRYNPSLLGPLQAREAHTYEASSVLSVEVAYQHFIEQLDNQITRSINTIPPAEE